MFEGDILNKAIKEKTLDGLRAAVCKYISGKRLEHTFGVEREAAELGRIYLPDKLDSLRAAAILHDITKQYSYEKQLQCCEEFGIIPSDSELESPKLFHAKTGAALARRLFPDIVDDEIYGAILWHTTGRRGMTVFEQLIYLADYIEETRTFPDCVKLREYFYNCYKNSDGMETNRRILCDTMILSFDLTIDCLIGDGAPLDTNTTEARNDQLGYRKLLNTEIKD